MKREEAIEVLNKARPILATEELRTAIDMAIEALSADSVSREHHDMEVKEPHGFTADEWYRDNFGDSNGK